jgi:replicative DNA helicase
MTASEQTEARYSRRIEAAAIGGLILCPRLLNEVRPWLEQGDFAIAHFGRWYGYICEMQDQGQPIDQVTLLIELRRNDDLGPDGRYAFELATITERVPIPGEPAHYARAVLEESTRRQLRIAGLRLAQVAQHGDVADVLADAIAVAESVDVVRDRWNSSVSDSSGGQRCSRDDALSLRGT